MTTEWDELMALVSGWLSGMDDSRVDALILDAHNGRPDGVVVTEDNGHLLRRYRNRVSADPARLIQDARDWQGYREA
jgi:hypothetical protein